MMRKSFCFAVNSKVLEEARRRNLACPACNTADLLLRHRPLAIAPTTLVA
jgi:hypothetical protein